MWVLKRFLTGRMRTAAAWFAERGYTCLEIDLGRHEDAKTSEELMKQYEMGE